MPWNGIPCFNQICSSRFSSKELHVSGLNIQLHLCQENRHEQIIRVDKDVVVKVADFGLARDIYSDEYYRLRHKASVPIKWMPPESLYDGYFNEGTDVV